MNCKKANQTGASIVIVLSVLSVLMLLGFSTYKSILLMIDFTHETITLEQEYRLCHGLLECGISYGKNHYDELIQDITTHEFNSDVHNNYTGMVSLGCNQAGITIESSLMAQDVLKSKLSCRLMKNSDQKLIIHDFQRNKSSLY